MSTQRDEAALHHAIDLTKIDAYVTAQMQSTQLPGLALAIVKGKQFIHLRSFGVADPTGRLVTPQTPFIVGSITKSFTALAIMQLVEASKIKLDVPVQRYISWFRVDDPAASSQITVRHLLNHTSGIPRYVGRKLLAGKGEQTMEQRVRELRAIRLTQQVGTTFQYSNTNYLVLGQLVQTVSGQSYEEYIRQHIFVPLEMQHSFLSQAEGVSDGMATGYRWWFGVPFPADLPFLRDALPAGFLLSSAEDMAHYLFAHLNDGHYGETSVLSPAGMAELHRPEAVVASTDAKYGMGWLTESLNGISMLAHSGDTANFHADMVLLPETRYGIIVLTNANNALAGQIEQAGKLGLGSIAMGVTSLLAGERPPAPRLTFRTFYLIFDLLILLLTVLQIRSLVKLLQRWRQPLQIRPLNIMRRVVLPLGWELGGPFIVLTRLPKWSDASWSILKLYAPDLASWLFGMVFLSFTSGMIRIAHTFLRLRFRGEEA